MPLKCPRESNKSLSAPNLSFDLPVDGEHFPIIVNKNLRLNAEEYNHL